MSHVPGIRYRQATSADGPELVQLFERCGSGCYCRYWHFAGDKNAWLDRLAHAPELSARELEQDLATASNTPHGVIASSGEQVIGWMKLTFAQRVDKLYAQRPYRGLPLLDGHARRVLTVGCFLVDPDFRRKGVARSLLAEGLELARRVGATAIEAFPRQAEMLGEPELWMGPFEIYAALGFEAVYSVGQYPVLRKAL